MIPLIAIVLALGVSLVAAALQRRSSRLRGIGKGLLVSYLTVMLLLGVGELYFRFFYADSEGRQASNNWIDRYWHTNSLGYRDREWTPADWSGRTTVAVVGDSFTAGWGIPNPADRYSDVLAAHLGDDYAVFNLGLPGAATPQELESLQSFPVTPDVVILQYFLNDAEYAALTQGMSIPQQEAPPLAQVSHLADYFYARLSAGFGVDYWAAEYALYDNPAVWAVHQSELEAFAAYVESIGARLIVVIFPNMQDPVASVAYVDRVAQVFQARGQTEILRLFDAVAAFDLASVIVSPRDAHPSPAFHRHVGDLIFQQFFTPPA